MKNQNPLNLSQTTLALLAGGLGIRMGQPKAFLRIQNQPILAWLLHHLQWPGPTLLITSPAIPSPPAADLFTLHAQDQTPNQGPLAGLIAALEKSPTNLTIALPVDMPHLTPSHLHHLLQSLHHRENCNALMYTINSQLEPFPLALRRSALPLFQSHLQNNQRSLQSLTTDPTIQTILPPLDWPPNTWTNLNTPADLAAFESAHPESTPK